MATVTIEIPEELSGAITALVAAVEQARRRASGGRPVDYANVEREVASRTAAVEREAHRVILQSLDVDAPRVRIDGEIYTRVHRAAATYYTLAGDVVVERSLYRRERNGKVVDAVSLRAGVVGAGWPPETAQAIAHLAQQGTSREAEQTAYRLGRLPYGRSSFERVGHQVGASYAAREVQIADALIETFAIPSAARSVSFALDRVSIPMEEPRPRPVGRPRKDAPLRPVSRVFRMAYCGTVTFHDEKGEALHTIRYGATPNSPPEDICDRLYGDAVKIQERRPDLRFVLLSDGAPEMWNLLRSSVSRDLHGVEVFELLDLWHLLEKLAAAAHLIHGEQGARPVMHSWRVDLLNRSGACDRILKALRASGKEAVTFASHRPVHEAITYLENHRDLLGYPSARRLGLPVGSGAVEATCKSLFQVRMKRSGARWKESTARNIIHLRSLALSDRWEPAMRLTLAPLRKAVRAAA